MDSDDREVRSSSREVVAEDNVVRLPREWLGPPEDLVPIGEETDDFETGATLDFWGTTVGPPAEAAVPGSDEHSVRRRPTGSRTRTRAAFGARRISGGATPGEGRRPRRVPGVAVIGIATALILIALSISPSDRPTHNGVIRTRAQARSAAQTSAPLTANVLSPGRELALLHVKRTARTHRRSSVVNRRRTHMTSRRHPAPSRSAARHVSPAPAARTVASSSTTPSTTTPAAASYRAPATSYATHPAAASSGTSAGSSQPATGSSGALSPGTSPDG